MLRRAAIAVPLLLATIAACSDMPTPAVMENDPSAGNLNVAPSQVADVPAVDIDLPPQARPWDTSVEALEGAIAADDGQAIIGFKTAGARRSLETGRRESVPARDIRAALALLEQRSVAVLEYFPLIGGAHVQLPPGVASQLREHPLIDYVEPLQQWEVQGVAAPLKAFGAASFLTQTTPWGIDMVRAPEAWSVATGSGATIQIIDTGHDRGHQDLPLVPLSNCLGLYDGCSDGAVPHGTHVAGIVLARDNSLGVVGVAP